MAAPRKYGLCVCNDGHAVSLDLWKVYRLLADRVAEKDGFVRVVDNEGEDYLYPDQWFVPIDVPAIAERRIKLSTRTESGAKKRIARSKA